MKVSFFQVAMLQMLAVATTSAIPLASDSHSHTRAKASSSTAVMSQLQDMLKQTNANIAMIDKASSCGCEDNKNYRDVDNMQELLSKDWNLDLCKLELDLGMPWGKVDTSECQKIVPEIV